MHSVVRASVVAVSALTLTLAACSGDEAIIDDGVGASGPTTGTGCVASEELCDGEDNDCDGEVDEDCACIQGATQECYSGPTEVLGVGECKKGQQTCDERGQWGECVGEAVPIDELCDTLDNNCDGQADEGFEEVTCGLGICQVVADECIDGVPNPCMPGTPMTEACNGNDDDCDGQIDESCTCMQGQMQPCYPGPPNTEGMGVCVAGTQTCGSNGMWGNCTGAVIPTIEQCDGDDDDCDGTVDDGNPDGGAVCNTGLLGICAPGTQQCVGGALQCVQNLQPATETCNGIDDDCNGTPDNGDPGGGGSCNTGLNGVCGPGTYHCVGAIVQCTQNQMASPELCDLLDNDCDAQTDEGNPGGGSACTVSGQQGVCAAGVTMCSGGNLTCTQVNNPVNEAPTVNCSNSLDDDCDGPSDAGDTGCCPHNMCTQGPALDPVCAGAQPNCINTVCANDPFCCTQTWDGFCISEINTECFSTMCSTCSHNLCVTGGPLSVGCDGGWCVQNVCANDPFCCTSGWDGMCVSAVATQCAPAGC